jgi:Flp pilus assembly protein TadD
VPTDAGAHEERGEILEQLGRPDAAKAAFERARKLERSREG